MSKKYPIRFEVELGEFEKDGKKIPVDELLICTIVRFGESKKGSIAWHSVKNNKMEEMDNSTIFQAWKALAANLLKRDDLNNAHRELLQNVVNSTAGGVIQIK